MCLPRLGIIGNSFFISCLRSDVSVGCGGEAGGPKTGSSILKLRHCRVCCRCWPEVSKPSPRGPFCGFGVWMRETCAKEKYKRKMNVVVRSFPCWLQTCSIPSFPSFPPSFVPRSPSLLLLYTHGRHQPKGQRIEGRFHPLGLHHLQHLVGRHLG